METSFTPVSAVIGGTMIGVASAILLIANGRIAGVSGILGRTLWPTQGDSRSWRIAFVLGLPLGAWVVSYPSGGLTTYIAASPGVLVLAGLLVGFGTQLGSGCTSGHGICGISRGSTRSTVATLTFMATGVLTVFIVRHLLGGAS